MKEHDRTEHLVRTAQAGDQEAFATLFERFRDRLRPWIESRIALRLGPRLDVEEILQETFFRALEARGRFTWQGEGSFHSWLCGIARNVLFKAGRRAEKDRRLQTGDDRAARDTSPSRKAVRNERFDRLAESLKRLRPDYREVLHLARIDGLKTDEIARRMGRSQSAVKHLIARALKKLRKEFGDTESLHLPPRSLEVEGEGDHGE